MAGWQVKAQVQYVHVQFVGYIMESCLPARQAIPARSYLAGRGLSALQLLLGDLGSRKWASLSAALFER